MLTNQFFTEFPVRDSFSSSELIDYFLRWVSGIIQSNFQGAVLRREIGFSDDKQSEFNLDSGESLRLASVNTGELCVYGVQYDLPDDDGRIWRTEVILSGSESKFISVRISCNTGNLSVNVMTPKRPVFLRQIVEAGIGGNDGGFVVSDIPHYISDQEADKARDAILGTITRALPVIYVSSRRDGSLPIDAERLAFETGGMPMSLLNPIESSRF